jgi:hypothetical protein
VADGPWKLTGHTGSGGTITFSANDSHFAGKPHLSKFEELPFTSDAAEYNALRAGLVDYGCVPTEDASIAIPGYKITAWVQWGINFFTLNYANPAVGKIFEQVYIKQATAHSTVKPGEASVCTRPGSGSDECGAGIAGGTALSFKMPYASGSSSLTGMICIVLTAVAFNFIGDALRDALEVRLQRR